MAQTDPELQQVEERISQIEDNLRDLVEEASAYSGSGDEERTSDRIADQERELETLKTRRDQLLGREA
jgi:predicted  nucleic acid-binding Zn-ribbon protein